MCTFIFIAKIVEIDKYNAMGASTNAHQMFWTSIILINFIKCLFIGLYN